MKSLDSQILAFSLACLCLTACQPKQPPKTKEQVMAEKLEERFMTWKKEMTKTCRERVMERAVAIVDSTIIANARLNRDSAYKYLIPERPVEPEIDFSVDTSEVKPLLSSKEDSIE